jgi:ribonuclease HIII
VTQRTLVLLVPPSRGADLRAALAAGDFDFRPVPHALFSAKGEGAVATLYTSGKLVVQAADPEAFVARWIADVRPAGAPAERGIACAVPAGADDAVIGSDEVGKGDYFGPLVVAAVRLEAGQSDEIRRSGVRDSKTLTDEQCLRLGGALRARYAHAIARLDPPEYNRRYQPGRLNELLADLHTQALTELARPGIRVVVDRFANEKLLERRLKSIGIRLEQRVRAESEPAVAAASVLAREEFLTALKELSAEAAVDLHKGAGDPVDRSAKRYVALHGFEELSKVAKVHFKNTQKIGGLGRGLG